MEVGVLIRIFWVISSASSLSTDLEFLKEFFKERNVLVTFNACWKKEIRKDFLGKMAKERFRQVGFYREFMDFEIVKTWSNQHFLVLDLRNCNTSEILLDKLNATRSFLYPLKYIFLLDSHQFGEFALKLENYQLLPNAEIITASFTGKFAVLRQPYKVDRTSKLTWENYGNWSPQAGLIENYKTIPLPQRRANLKRANLRVVIVIFVNDTWNHLTDYRYPGVDTFSKQDFESMRCVLEHLNVNYTLMGVDSYGYYDPTNGEFDGLVHAIQTGAADVSGVSIYFTEDRYAVLDLIKMGNPLAMRFLVKKPATSYVKNIFYITFNFNVWLASLLVLMVSGIVVKVILNWEVKNKDKVKQNRYSLSDVTLIALEAVCQQGTTTEPQSLSGRILALIFFGAFMFIYVSYSANIVVLLQSTTQINNIQELLESRIEAGGCDTPYMKNYFESVHKGPLRHLYLQKIYPDKYYPLEVGMEKLRKGNFAFHVALQGAYEYILDKFANYEICTLQELPGYIEENRGYIAVPKHSPYKDIFKVAILKVDEYGLQRRTNLRIIMKPQCFSQSGSFKSIGIYDCEQVFQMFVYGTILAVGIFLLELLTSKLKLREINCNRKISIKN